MKVLRTLLATGVVLLAANASVAQTSVGEKAKQDLKEKTKFGGYGVGKAGYTSSESASANSSFEMRLARLYVDGQILDFKYKMQVEMTGVGGSTGEKGPRIVDLWAEWQRYDFFKVRLGQFKRAFTFENPMNPWDIGFGGYSQLTTKLAGMSDIVGEHASNGRDLGLQVQGDFVKSHSDGHYFLHYQLGLYNGQGINHADKNDRKDVIGGLTVSPVKGLQIGAWGWSGNYVTSEGKTIDRKRMSYGAKYDDGAWSARAEYAHDKADVDAWYVMVGAPVTDKFKLYGKWDVLRQDKDFAKQKAIYGVSGSYYFTKNFKLQLNYNYNRDKATTGDGKYSTADLQVYFRF